VTRFGTSSPPYPNYRRQQFDGDLPLPPINQPDTRPIANNPAYSRYRGTRGRSCAGVDDMNAEGIKDYPNELNLLAEADDVVGNGLFDPPGSHGNVHPDEGIFADNVNLPGYIARDRFYEPSEVRDVTTGDPVVYVPGGAVAIDDAQAQAFRDRLRWQLPPGVNPWEPNPVNETSIVRPREAGFPIGQTEAANQPSPMKYFVMAAVGGLSIGMLVSLVMPKKR